MKIKQDDIVFYKYNWDWREEIHNSTLKEFDENPEDKVKIDVDDYENIIKVYRLMKKKNKSLIKVNYKNEDESISHYVEWKDFNPNKMKVVLETEETLKKYETNLNDIIKSKKAPGMFQKTDESKMSMMHNGKLDEGAMNDMLEKGLYGAKERASKRQKATGHAFRKNNLNRIRLRRKKNG